MDRQRWQKIEGILDEALDKDNPRARKLFIRNTCKNKELREEITTLLKFIEEAEKENFLC